VIAILVAVKQELRPILQLADTEHIVRQEHLDFHEGTLGGQPVALLALGVGKECARIAAEITIRCYRPDLVISAGFGGGLADGIEDGDIVVGTDVLELYGEMGDQLRWEATHRSTALSLPNTLKEGSRVHFGRIITTDEMVLRAANKVRLGKATGALSVDMETSAVAAVCAAHETGFLAIRCITDNNHENLPDEFNDFFVLGQLQKGRVLRTCLRHPREFIYLARLGRRARVAGRHLAGYLETSLRQLQLPSMTARQL